MSHYQTCFQNYNCEYILKFQNFGKLFCSKVLLSFKVHVVIVIYWLTKHVINCMVYNIYINNIFAPSKFVLCDDFSLNVYKFFYLLASYLLFQMIWHLW